MTDCMECGDEVDEDEAVYGSGTIRDSGLEKLSRGETLDAEELFGFDDGPYCSLECSIQGGDEDA